MTLPKEILDKIFLELDYETLQSSRQLQSDYVKKTTIDFSLYAAARNGNLRNMKWLLKKEKDWLSDYWLFEYTAMSGNLENMKWLKEHGCYWNEEVFIDAVRKLNLENLQWLKDQGCPWDYDTKRRVRALLPKSQNKNERKI